MTNIKTYIAVCYDNEKIYPSWRWGQTLFNTLLQLEPDLANEIRGTDLDPYYSASNDTTQTAFWVWLSTQLNT